MTEPLNEFEALKLAQEIDHALDSAKFLATKTPSRELSLVITKLEEAELWLIRVPSTIDF